MGGYILDFLYIFHVPCVKFKCVKLKAPPEIGVQFAELGVDTYAIRYWYGRKRGPELHEVFHTAV